jgi:transcriptional regulator with XRE-family HTH domain
MEKEIFLKNLGNKIKFFRELKSLSLENMADELKMSVSGYHKIEQGETNVPICRTKQIADALGVSIENLTNMDSNQTVNFNFKSGKGFGNSQSTITINEENEEVKILKQEMDTMQNLMQAMTEKLNKLKKT